MVLSLISGGCNEAGVTISTPNQAPAIPLSSDNRPGIIRGGCQIIRKAGSARAASGSAARRPPSGLGFRPLKLRQGSFHGHTPRR